ncbi:MAG: hypothetical protein ACREJC_11300, partial [Tepidisphaeraceae bacterium]
PSAFATPLAVVVAVLAIGSTLITQRVRGLSLVSFLAVVVCIAASCLLAWGMSKTLAHRATDRELKLLFVGLMAIALVCAAATCMLSRKRARSGQLLVASTLTLSIVGIALAVYVPGGSYLTAWPALAGAGAILTRGRFGIPVLFAIVTTLLWTPVLYLAFLALGLGMAGWLAAPTALAASCVVYALAIRPTPAAGGPCPGSPPRP